jgi:hypothetical protein
MIIGRPSQALREGAPVLRAKRRGKDLQATASSDEDEKCTSSESSPSGDHEEKENETPSSRQTKKPDKKDAVVIRPSARLLRRGQVEPITLDMLTSGERDMYLNDFLPPNTSFPSLKSEGQVSPALEALENNPEHQVVSV